MSKITYKHKDKVLHTTELTTKKDFNKVAEDIFNTGKYPFSVRSGVSQQLLKEAKKFDAETDTVKRLEKIAGYGTGTVDRVCDILRNRALLLYKESKDLSSKLQKAADTLNGKYEYTVPHETLEKTANFVDVVDRATGLHQHYDNGVSRPEDVFRYTLTDNDNIKKYAVNLKNNVTISSADVKENFDDIKTVLEDACDIKVGTVKEAAEQLSSLDRARADLIVKTAL